MVFVAIYIMIYIISSNVLEHIYNQVEIGF